MENNIGSVHNSYTSLNKTKYAWVSFLFEWCIINFAFQLYCFT